VIITITDRWRIKSNPHCWMTELRSKSKSAAGPNKPPAFTWNAQTFHDSLPAAVKWLGEHFAREDYLETDSLEEALNRVSAIHEDIASMLSEAPQGAISDFPYQGASRR